MTSILASKAHRLALLRNKPAGQLLIHEIYRSIQGESTFAGLPCVFVRLAVCDARCVWCFVPETPVLMADWSWRALGDLKPGDEIIAIERKEAYHSFQKLSRARVTHLGMRQAPTVVVNGSVRCTPDHRFWLTGKNNAQQSIVHSGWREVERAVGCRALFVTDPVTTDQALYERGWLAGMADGDGCFWTLRRRNGYRRFRLALKNQSLLERARLFARRAGFCLRPSTHFHKGFAPSATMDCLYLTRDEECRSLEDWLNQDVEDFSWRYGYLGGILDAEGSLSVRLLRISQSSVCNGKTWKRIQRTLEKLNLAYTVERKGFYTHRSNGELWRILTNARPAKPSILDAVFESHPHHSRTITSVEPTGRIEPVVTLSTTAGSFIAGGYLVKNCDTPHAFNRGDLMPLEVVLETVQSYHCPLVEITGGEPLLQEEVFALMSALADRGMTVLLETSGAHDVSRVDPRVHIIMDLKCPDSGECEGNRWANLDLLKSTDQIKFVLASRRDFEWAEKTIRARELDRRFMVLLSPVFGAVEPKQLAEWLLASGLNVRMQLQLHKYVWDPQARGV